MMIENFTAVLMEFLLSSVNDYREIYELFFWGLVKMETGKWNEKTQEF